MPSKDVSRRLADIVEYTERVARYVGGRDREAFFADDMVRDAVLRCLQCISEAAKKLGGEAGLLMPKVCGCPSLANDCRAVLSRTAVTNAASEDKQPS